MSILKARMTKVGEGLSVKASAVNDFRVNATCVNTGIDVRCKVQRIVPTFSVTTTLDNVTSNAPASVTVGGALVVVLTGTGSNKVQANSVEVTMGETDITSTAYDHSAKTITIASVTGDVSITAIGRPYDAEVEYLQGDGTAYIDTGVKITSTVRFDVHLEIVTPPSGTSYYLFGGRIDSSSGAMRVWRNSNSNWYYAYGTKSGNVANSSVNADKVRCQNLSEARRLYVNSGQVALSSQTFSTDEYFFLFCMNSGGGTASSKPPVKIYSAKLYSSANTLVRDYIPVKNNNVGYLYDKVSGTLYGNANTSSGAFTYGNEV